jgi:hypothetical protein
MGSALSYAATPTVAISPAFSTSVPSHIESSPHQLTGHNDTETSSISCAASTAPCTSARASPAVLDTYPSPPLAATVMIPNPIPAVSVPATSPVPQTPQALTFVPSTSTSSSPAAPARRSSLALQSNGVLKPKSSARPPRGPARPTAPRKGRGPHRRHRRRRTADADALVAAAADVRLVGRTVSLFWEAGGTWHDAHVLQFEPARTLHLVRFVYGKSATGGRSEGWVDLAKTSFRLVAEEFGTSAAANVPRSDGTAPSRSLSLSPSSSYAPSPRMASASA